MPETVLRDKSGRPLLEVSDDGLTLNVVTVAGISMPVYTVNNTTGSVPPAQVASVLLDRIGQITQRLQNDNDDPSSYSEFNVAAGKLAAAHRSNAYLGALGTLSSDPTSAGRAYLAGNNSAGLNEGIDFFASFLTGHTTPKHRFYTNGTGAGQLRVQIDDTGLTIVGAGGRAVGQTAAVANVFTRAVGAVDASFMVSGNILVTTNGTQAFTMTCSYTDEGNTPRTLTLTFGLVAGGALSVTSIAGANGAVPYMGVEQRIRAKAGTNIVFATTGTFTGCTYNVEADARPVA